MSGAAGSGTAFASNSFGQSPNNCCCDEPENTGPLPGVQPNTNLTASCIDLDPAGVVTARTPRVVVPVLNGALDLTAYRVNGYTGGVSPGMPVGTGGSGGARVGVFRNVSTGGTPPTPSVTNGTGGHVPFDFVGTSGAETDYAPPANLSGSLAYFNGGALETWRETSSDSTYYVYDANGNVRKRVTLANAAIYYQYASIGGSDLVTGLTGDLPGEIYFEYNNTNPAGRWLLAKTVHRDPQSQDYRQWTYDYEASGNLSEISGPEGCTQQWVYDVNGFPIREVDTDNYTTYFEYTNFGTPGTRISKIVFPTPVPSSIYFEFYDGSSDPLTDLPRTYKKTIEDPYLCMYYTYDQSYPVLTQAQGAPGRSPKNVCAPDFGYHPPDLAKGLKQYETPPGLLSSTIKSGSNIQVSGGACPIFCLPPQRRMDGTGNQIENTDGQGRTSSFGYDNDHNRVATLDIFGRSTYFAYNSTHQVTRQVSARWPEAGAPAFTSYYTYDAQGNMTDFLNPLGDSSHASYARGGVPLARSDLRNNWAYYQFDGSGRMLRMLDPTNASAYFAYDIFSNALCSVSPRWGESTAAAFSAYYSYDTHNRPTQVVDAEGDASYFVYGSRCTEGPKRSAAWVQGAFRTSYFAYDGMSRVNQSLDAAGGATYYAYVGATSLAGRMLDARGNASYYGYDGSRRLVNTLDALQGSTYFGYDYQSIAAVGVRWPESSAANFTAYYFYNAPSIPSATREGGSAGFEAPRSRLAVKVDALGDTTYYAYDANANPVAKLLPRWVENAASFAWYYRYDAVDRQSAVLDPRGGTMYYRYDANGNQDAVQDQNLNTTYFGFDAVSRRAAQLDALNGASYFGYDAAGNQIRSEDELQHTSYFGFDRVNRRIRTLDPIGASTYFGYNEAGDLLRSVAPRWPESSAANFTSYFAYDPLSRQTATLDPLGFSAYYAYDANGNLLASIQANWPDWITDTPGISTYYCYDALNRTTRYMPPISRAVVAPAAWYYAYDAAGNRTVALSPRYAEFAQTPPQHTSYYAYDALNRLSITLDPLTYSTYFGYDANGNQTRVVGKRWLESSPATFTSYFGYDNLDRRVASRTPLGNSSYFGYDPVGNQIAVVGPRWGESTPLDFTTYYGYDALNRRIRSRDDIGEGSYFAYDAVGNLLRTQDHIEGSSSAVSYYGYDANNRMTASEDALLRAAYFAYDLGGNTVAQLLPGDLVRASYFAYDANNQLLAQLSPVFSATYYTYDGAGNRTSVVSPRWVESNAAAFTTYLNRDNANNLAAITDPLGGVRLFSYNYENQLYAVTDERSNVTFYTRDADNRVYAVTDALTNAWIHYLDGDGNTVLLQLPVGNSPLFSYDADNRLIQSQNAAGVGMYYAYDAGNNRTRAMLVSAGHTTYFGYDNLDRLSKVQDPVGSNSYFAYDVGGNLNRSMDPNLHTTYFGYDLLDRILRVEDPLLNTSYFGYDLAGNRCREEDANQHTVYYAYDAGNRVTGIMDALQVSSYYAYDAASNLKVQRDNIGNSIYFAYDALDRKTAQLFDMTSEAQYFAYDPTSNLTTTLDNWGASYYAYDPINRVSQRVDPAAHALYYAYDGVSDLLALQYPGTSGSCYYAYDSGNRMARANLVTDAPSNGTCYYAYDGFRNMARKRYFNNVTCYYSYDAAQRVAGMDYRTGANAQVGLFTFARDAAGNITTLGREGTLAVYYAYDSANRLLSEVWRTSGSTQVYGFSYDYDAVGNRMKMRRESTAGTEVQSAYYAYDKDNSLTRRITLQTPGGELSQVTTYYYYDANGSEICEVDTVSGDPALYPTYFTYGPQNMVTSITPPPPYVGDENWSCAYDAQLNRYQMSFENGGTVQLNVMEGLKALEFYDASDPADPTARFAHGASPVPDIGTLVEIQNDLNGTPVSYAPIMDHRGSVFALVDASGNVVANREYSAYGELLYSTGNWGTTANPVTAGYQTNWQDITVGGKRYGINAAGRVYDYETGRFLGRDPVPNAITISETGKIPALYSKTVIGRSIVFGRHAKRYNLNRFARWFLNEYRTWSNSPLNQVDPIGTFDQETQHAFGLDVAIERGTLKPQKEMHGSTFRGSTSCYCDPTQLYFTFSKCYEGSYNYIPLGQNLTLYGLYVELQIAMKTFGGTPACTDFGIIQIVTHTAEDDATGMDVPSDPFPNGPQTPPADPFDMVANAAYEQVEARRQAAGWSDPSAPSRGWRVDSESKSAFFENSTSGTPTVPATLSDAPGAPFPKQDSGTFFYTCVICTKGNAKNTVLGCIKWGYHYRGPGVPEVEPIEPSVTNQIPQEFIDALSRFESIPGNSKTGLNLKSGNTGN